MIARVEPFAGRASQRRGQRNAIVRVRTVGPSLHEAGDVPLVSDVAGGADLGRGDDSGVEIAAGIVPVGSIIPAIPGDEILVPGIVDAMSCYGDIRIVTTPVIQRQRSA